MIKVTTNNQVGKRKSNLGEKRTGAHPASKLGKHDVANENENDALIVSRHSSAPPSV